jgi:hypothetical protein
MTFNPVNLANLRRDVEGTLAIVAKRYGIKFTLGKIHYQPTSFHAKLEASVMEDDGVDAGERERFAKMASLFGFTPADYNRAIDLDGRRLYVVGFKTRANRMPVILRDDTQKTFKASLPMVARAMRVA